MNKSITLAQEEIMPLWRCYLALTKPKVVALMLLTALVGMCLSNPDVFVAEKALLGLIGIGLMAGAAASFNHLIDERIDAIGVLAILSILLGTFVMHMESLNLAGVKTVIKNVSNKGSLYAILAALTVAGYTLWDKISISKMEPFLYFYLYTLIVAVLYNSVTFIKVSKDEVKKEWNLHSSRIIQVGFFNSFTYILVLTALTMSKATYVGGLRQLSIVVGAFLGYKLLREKLSLPKIVGIMISIIGGSLIYLAA